MSVDDHGLEVLKKAAIEIIPGDKSEYLLRVSVESGSITVSPADAPSEDPTTGDNLHESGSVSTSFVPVPAVAGGTITSFLIECPEQGDTTAEIHVSLDGGTGFKKIAESASWVWTPRGDQKQIYIKSNKLAGVAYDIVFNRNDP